MKIEIREKEIIFKEVDLSECAIHKKSGRPFMKVQCDGPYNAVYLDTGELVGMNPHADCIRCDARAVIEI